MLRSISRYFSRLIPFLFFIVHCSFSQQNIPPLQQEAILLSKVLEKNHYQPKQLDEKLSRQIILKFIDLLDPDHVYFKAPDVEAILLYSTSLPDEINGKSWKFLPQVTALYKQRLLQADKMSSELLQKPFTFLASETITLNIEDNLDFAATDKDYILRWQKWLKYQTLQQLVNLYDQKNISAPDKGAQVLSKEPAMRQKVQLIQKRAIKRILEHPSGFESYIASLFFRAYSASFDPHTVYLSKADRDRFEAALSTESLSFGIDLDEKDNGDIEIARVTPGGPAWKSNELHKGDVLTALKWQGKDETDLAGADIDEVETILETSATGKLEITVRKSNGGLQTVSLLKEKIRADENIVKSFILKGDKKIGYISLPGFYTEWENSSSQGCANDVAKEIVKLKHENIEGLILDIRFNGGGSLTEGINLAGIFINEGPLCVIHDRGTKPSVLKDNNRGTIYDGPLVVMVNGQSASASEILAATLQDYNRAVIVGSPTFGKSTGQVILPLDTSHIHPVNRVKPNLQAGYAKVTVSKLYRITGTSAQLKGVKPDVVLPDIYQNFYHRESMYPFALTSDSVARKIYYTALPALPITSLSQKSADRIGSHPAFATVKKLNEIQPDFFKETSQTIPLELTYFKTRASEMYNWYEAIEKVREKKTEIYTVENTNSDKELLRMDSYGKELNDHTLQSIQHSFYIEESYKIIGDLILLQRNK
ncbi:hypothetical protein GXP67_26275 [Rhodocytophaga rosea]|uniref:PDZ domain-containing protein n=1 Tax=Rhodocytophaga rosea TaxID=2704465 RepID=A0A6C0GPF0_9BACT|nr:S41 family peptidase [Rhodocytophaga rosea]QHT69901.1 hypothetical protein GXP67_26275 [Rhodocytophaga rosea]